MKKDQKAIFRIAGELNSKKQDVNLTFEVVSFEGDQQKNNIHPDTCYARLKIKNNGEVTYFAKGYISGFKDAHKPLVFGLYIDSSQNDVDLERVDIMRIFRLKKNRIKGQMYRFNESLILNHVVQKGNRGQREIVIADRARSATNFFGTLDIHNTSISVPIFDENQINLARSATRVSIAAATVGDEGMML